MKRNIHILNKIILLALCLVFTSCASWFQSKISMSTTSELYDLQRLFTYTSETVELDMPEQVFASEGIYSDKILISWKEVENASSYVIEKCVVTPDENGDYEVPSEESFKVLNSYVYDTTYTDTILESPSYNNEEYAYKYYYRISAQNIGEGYVASDFTDITNSKTAACGYLYTPVQNVSADKGKSVSEINVKWDAAENAKSYKVYRCTEGGTAELKASVSASQTYYTDEISTAQQGIEYYYTIIALNTYGQESAKSAEAMGYSLKDGAPAAPSNVIVKDGYGTSTKSLTVTWDSVTANPDDDGNEATVLYNIYRASSDEPTVITMVANRKSATTFEDSSALKTGVYYYYYVMTVAVYESGEESKSGFSASGPTDDVPAMGYLLSPPTTLTVSEDNVEQGKVLVKWKPAIGSDLVEYTYKIYTSSTVNGSYTMIVENIPSTTDSDGYISIEMDKCNFYKVSTVNSANTESALSSATAPHPSAPRNVTATKNVKISESWSANSNGVYPVKITWDAPENENPAAYTVYRSLYQDKNFKKVETTTQNYCIDTNSSAKAGEMYYYKVVSLNIQSQGSHANDPTTDTAFNCRGYGAITRDQWFREYNKTIMHSQSKLTLMHKSSDMDKLGTETISGDIGGSLTYTSSIAGLGAEIKMPYTNYSDFYCGDAGKLYIGTVNGYSKSDSYSNLSSAEKARCVEYFIVTGSTDTSCNMSANGNMSNSVSCTGMYPGKAVYDNLKIVSGAAGGGYYVVTTYDLNGNEILSADNVSWTVGEEPTGYNYGS